MLIFDYDTDKVFAVIEALRNPLLRPATRPLGGMGLRRASLQKVGRLVLRSSMRGLRSRPKAIERSRKGKDCLLNTQGRRDLARGKTHDTP